MKVAFYDTAKLKISHGLTPMGHHMLLGHPNNIHWGYMADMKWSDSNIYAVTPYRYTRLVVSSVVPLCV
jgi:hypothetical protein